MQFEERAYTPVEIADITVALIDKFDYKVFSFEEKIKRRMGFRSLSEFRQHPDTDLYVQVEEEGGVELGRYDTGFDIFSKDRIRNNHDKLVAACADIFVGLMFEPVGLELHYVHKPIVNVSLVGFCSSPRPVKAKSAAMKHLNLILPNAKVSVTLASLIDEK